LYQIDGLVVERGSHGWDMERGKEKSNFMWGLIEPKGWCILHTLWNLCVLFIMFIFVIFLVKLLQQTPNKSSNMFCWRHKKHLHSAMTKALAQRWIINLKKLLIKFNYTYGYCINVKQWHVSFNYPQNKIGIGLCFRHPSRIFYYGLLPFYWVEHDFF